SQGARNAFNPSGMTPLLRGLLMSDQGSAKSRGGNCDEAADVAAFLAWEKNPEAVGTIFMVYLDKPADHGFWVVNAESVPTWGSVYQMFNETRDVIVIDPWLKVACYARDYPLKAHKRFNKWQTVNKRIKWWGKDGDSDGWYAPLGDYERAFMYSKLHFAPINAK